MSDLGPDAGLDLGPDVQPISPQASPFVAFLVTADFPAQSFQVGERVPVTGVFQGTLVWTAVSAAFTLWSYGDIVNGYNAIGAALSVDTTGTLWSAQVALDLTTGAAHLVPAGEYTGEFAVTDSSGFIYKATAPIAVASEPGPTEIIDFAIEGGIG